MDHLSVNWTVRSAIAGITVWNVSFRLYPGTIETAQVTDFLEGLRRQLDRKLLIIWDGLAAHRSRGVREQVEGTNGMIRLARLPAYAPELNPVEYVWGYSKHYEWPTCCPKDFAHLGRVARSRLRSMQRRPKLVAAFWQQAQVPM